jgi:hypothetical protein
MMQKALGRAQNLFEMNTLNFLGLKLLQIYMMEKPW